MLWNGRGHFPSNDDLVKRQKVPEFSSESSGIDNDQK